MSNPWMKKNPFMSMWLSTANRFAGSLRGQVSAQAKRQAKTAATEATHQAVRMWSTAITAPLASKRTRRR